MGRIPMSEITARGVEADVVWVALQQYLDDLRGVEADGDELSEIDRARLTIVECMVERLVAKKAEVVS